jgi:hypothetical protein
MKRFSELGIEVKSIGKFFDCGQVSILDVINSEIEVKDFIPNVPTKNGPRHLVNYVCDGKEGKFFTGAIGIKEALDKTPKEDFPFLTVIKSKGTGKNRVLSFT